MNCKNYHGENGDSWTVGGELKIESGAAVTINGKDITTELEDLAELTTELAALDGLTATAAELNVLDGITASTSELNVLDGITASTAELNILDGVTAEAAELNSVIGVATSAVFTIGAEAADAITVGVQLKNAVGENLAAKSSLFAYLSDDATGFGDVTVAPDGGVAFGALVGGIPLVASKAFQITSKADGTMELTITHAAGAKTMYLVLVLPTGKLAISAEIEFAA